MIRNFLVIAWRNMRKSKGYSAINIIGLATGMAVALLIGLWIWDELTFDRYHENHAKLAQIMTNQTFNGERGTGPAVSVPFGLDLRLKHTDVFKYVTLTSWDDTRILSVGDKQVSMTGMAAQPEFPRMVTLKMVEGSLDALKDPSTMLINTSVAKALFGDVDPINKTIKMDNRISLRVGGVYRDLPRNTTLYRTQFVFAWDKYTEEDWVKRSMGEWDNHSFQLFVQMNDGVSMDRANAAIKNIAKEHVKEGDEEEMLFPMDKWRLYSNFSNGKIDGGRIQFVWMFGIIGVFVLLLACINFMNLSTARSEKRAKEVGIRKTVGSLRSQLVWQLLTESVLIAFLAFVLSLVMVGASLPFFNTLSDKSMIIPWSNVAFWALALGFTIFTGVLSGSYPAFYLSAFEPIKVLKGTFRVGRFAALPRKILVVLQFTVSITLIIGTIIVFRQIQYAKNRPVGYTREGLISMDMNTPDIYGHYNALRGDLLATGSVLDMAEASANTTRISSNQIGFDWEGKDPTTTPLFGIVAVTHDYGSTIGWKILSGRDFSRNFPTDTGAMILNESAVKLMGLKDPVGKTIKWNGKPHVVDGIVRDMVMESPYDPLVPTIFYVDYNWTNSILIRIKPTVSVRTALAQMEPIFKRYDPGSPFSYHFTDEDYAEKFSDEERVGNLASVFACLAIFISCLGLFGLASFVAEQRRKEMGVRKVLGASVLSIWRLLSTEFVLLVIISCVIAAPLAWYYLEKWLEKYKYRTSISWWVFLVAALGALVITLLTVSFQAIRAATTSPVKSLRTE